MSEMNEKPKQAFTKSTSSPIKTTLPNHWMFYVRNWWMRIRSRLGSIIKGIIGGSP